MTASTLLEVVATFHFTGAAGTTNYLREPEVVGQLYTLTGTPRCCKLGYHGSIKALDALQYACGSWVGVRRLSGTFDRQENKLCATESTLIVERKDATNVLLLFAADCAERVLHLFESERPYDTRPRQCIETIRAFVRGEATATVLAAARDAAWAAARAAAWDAAWDAARAAAWDAARDAAWDAARAAARAAAWAAARAAAWDAARDAARAAAWDAVWDAAWDAEREWQAAELDRRLRELLGVEVTP